MRRICGDEEDVEDEKKAWYQDLEAGNLFIVSHEKYAKPDTQTKFHSRKRITKANQTPSFCNAASKRVFSAGVPMLTRRQPSQSDTDERSRTTIPASRSI
jgi:hypothetical protein